MALKGIDISSWQSGLNISAVPADFVIIKATQGTWMVDQTCDGFYQQCKAAGRLRGVYHYAEGGDPIAEADFFVDNCRGYIKDAILVVDWEGIDNPTFGSGRDAVWVKQWCDRVYETTGVKPLVYCSASVLSSLRGIGDYGMWVAQYADMNPTGYQENPWNEGEYDCAIRQYSSRGDLPGYNGDLDLDKAYMDAEAWMKYANPSGNSEVPKPQPTKDPLAGKSIDELAHEVLDGKYGNGDDRVAALGSKYEAVQARVNELVGDDEVIYTVRIGDTLSAIANKYNTTYQKIAADNGIANPDIIYVGQQLVIK